MTGATPASLDESFARLEKAVRERVANEQHGTKTFFDVVLFKTFDTAPTVKSIETLMRYRELCSGERFVTHASRLKETHANSPWDITTAQMKAMQGIRSCMTWRGMALFKSVFELALYPMLLWDLKPRTIIEIGSGMGASAMWLADQANTLGIDLHVFSVDKRLPPVEHDNVTFIEGNCLDIESVLPDTLLARLEHPWIAIEDAHVNVGGVLRHLRRFLHRGDYLVVEDSAIKEEELASFAAAAPELMVDTHYTDFFGYNATCCANSIFVKR